MLRPTRRGDRAAAHVTVRSYGPLGLAAPQGNHHAPRSVRALPPFTSRTHLPSRLAGLRRMDGRTSVLTRSQGTELDSLRAYVSGDDTRAIEAAMDAALLLGALAARAGDRVGLLAYDRRLHAQAAGLKAGDMLPTLVEAFASLKPALVETDARGLSGAVLAHAPRRSLLVLPTSPGALPCWSPRWPTPVSSSWPTRAGLSTPGTRLPPRRPEPSAAARPSCCNATA